MRNGIKVRSITLFIFGGIAQISREAQRPLAEFMIAIAGPLVSLTLGGMFLGLYYALRGSSENLGALLHYLGWINLVVAVFNMIPGFPLDGGRVFRAIIWGITSNYARATRIAARLGQIVGFVFIVGGIALVFMSNDPQDGISIYNALWPVLIGLFLINMAGASARQASIRDRLNGVQVRDLMAANPPTLPYGIDLRSLVNNYLGFTDRRLFVVSDGAKWMGVLDVALIGEIPRERWPNTTVGDIMTPRESVRTVQPGEDITQAVQAMDEADVPQIPVVDDGRVVGMLARDSVASLLRTRQELHRGA